MTVMSRRRFLFAVTASTVVAACGGDDGGQETSAAADASGGVRVIDPTTGAAIQADPPADLVILDVRTPDEYAEGHLEGSLQLDFYEPDFATRVGELDPDVPYLVYCRSGNRSGQTRALMEQLGFTDVADIDGGIVAWTDAGLPVVTD